MLKRRNLARVTVCAVSLFFLLPLILVACGDDDDDDGGDGGSGSAGDLVISDVWSRPAVLLDDDDDDHDEHDEHDEDDEHGDHDDAGTNGVVYMRIANESDEADRLLSAASDIARAVEVHTSNMVNGVMQMRPVEEGVEIPAGETVAFEQGGYHVMLIGLKQALAEGDSFEVELTFERAGTVTVESEVRVE